MGLKVVWRAGNAYAFGTVQGRRIRQSLGTRDHQQAEEARAALETRLWKQSVYGDDAVRTFEDAALSYLEAGGEARFMARLLSRAILRETESRAKGSIANPADQAGHAWEPPPGDPSRRRHPADGGCNG
jgi:hypothetical protein